ncbi:thioredoxin family protein [Candidatus Uabimicrobium sp. HlEnr_7]|uniref:thioredoxin family protein n=1 Tax=Candidatus Uabimicrobium helgolandensis TaxID=3095367 RepID=UPI0035565568
MEKKLIFMVFFLSLICAEGFRPLTLEQAQVFARQNNKNIVVYFDQENSNPCRLMKQLTFKNDQVQKWLNNNLSLKLVKSKAAHTIEKFNIMVFPTILILDKNEKVLQRIEGYIPAKNLLEIANAKVPRLDLTIKGHHMAYLSKRTQATITIENGHVPLEFGVLRIEAPNKLQILSGEGNPYISKNTASINVGVLKPKEKREYKITFISKHPGKYCLKVLFKSRQIEKRAEHCTTWRGFPALLIEMIDTVDPLLIGEETTLIVEISN